MSYHTYTTDALVLRTYNRLGADRNIKLFTRQHGMLFAKASGVREEKSKMRYSLQPYSRIQVTLVRGKHEWRLIGVECKDNVYFLCQTREARMVLMEIVGRIEQYIIGEEVHHTLFDDMMSILTLITHTETFITYHTCSPTYLSSIASFRLLSHLGYIAPSPILQSLASVPLSIQTAELYTEDMHRYIDEHIRTAHGVSHL
jgi:recombinational DNA repair protein (RecF pathway)